MSLSFFRPTFRSLEEHFSIDHNDIHITMSIGIAVFNSSIAALDAMLRQADLALYRAKDEGRNRYCFYTPEIDDRLASGAQLSVDLRPALQRNESELD